jgi:hypothetical protein
MEPFPVVAHAVQNLFHLIGQHKRVIYVHSIRRDSACKFSLLNTLNTLQIANHTLELQVIIP